MRVKVEARLKEVRADVVDVAILRTPFVSKASLFLILLIQL